MNAPGSTVSRTQDAQATNDTRNSRLSDRFGALSNHLRYDASPSGDQIDADVNQLLHDPDLAAPLALGQRDDFVIDLRIDGQTESYLKGQEFTPIAGSMRLRATRRGLDLGTATLALIISSPLLLPIVVVARLTSSDPIFFAQERVGRRGKVFRCYKFRTMHADAQDRLKHLLETDSGVREQWLRDQKVINDPRVTFVGRFLRKTSLDELPQLLNVLKGDMSIVGPRPVLPEETVRYGEALPLVLAVRPGITGLWQVSGRNNLPYPERVSLDVRYVDEQGLKLDARILAKTITSVATGHGAG